MSRLSSPIDLNSTVRSCRLLRICKGTNETPPSGWLISIRQQMQDYHVPSRPRYCILRSAPDPVSHRASSLGVYKESTCCVLVPPEIVQFCARTATPDFHLQVVPIDLIVARRPRPRSAATLSGQFMSRGKLSYMTADLRTPVSVDVFTDYIPRNWGNVWRRLESFACNHFNLRV